MRTESILSIENTLSQLSEAQCALRSEPDPRTQAYLISVVKFLEDELKLHHPEYVAPNSEYLQ